MIFLLILILLSLLLFHLYLHYSRSGRLIDKIPGPPILPVIGNCLNFLCSPEKALENVQNFAKKYYPIYKIWTLTFGVVFVQHPEDIKILLNCKINIDKGFAYDHVRYYIMDGIGLSSGDKNRQRRKLLNPSFSPQMLRASTSVMNSYTERLLQYFKSKGDEFTENLIPTFALLVLSNICGAVTGIDMKKYENEGRAFIHGIHEVEDISFWRNQRPYVKDWMLKFIPRFRRVACDVEKMMELPNLVINERREYYNKYLKNFYEKTEDEKKTENFCVLDSLFLAEEKGLIDDQGILEEVIVIFAAGFETTTLTLAFTLMLLAENETAQDLARKEVLESYRLNEGKFNITQLQKFEYIERCIRESLRLFTSFPRLNRRLKEDKQLRDYLIPAKTEVVISLPDVHKDPNFWPDPEKFEPDRFLNENIEKRHPFAYVPFSAGARSCIGAKFAMLMLKTVLAHILCNYHLKVVERTCDMKFKLDVTMAPIHPIHVKFVKIS